MKLLAILTLPMFMFAGASAAERPGKSQELIYPFPVLAIPEGASAAHMAIANDLANALGISVVVKAKTNPICCVWVDVTGWTPNPGKPGYIIVNQSGGSIVSASNEEQLKAAVKRFKDVMQGNGKDTKVPTGLLTNFPIAPNQ